MSKERFKLKIDRRVWWRGEVNSSLLERDREAAKYHTVAPIRHQCCVGIYLTALGVSDEQLVGRGCMDQNGLAEVSIVKAPWLFKDGTLIRSEDAQTLFTTNDARPWEAWGDPAREQALTEVFARNGVDVEFVDG